MKIVNIAEMRRIEEAADAGGQSYATMMELAGQSIAHVGHVLMVPDPAQLILVLVGPGNNGGDGLVAARHFVELGHPVTVYIWKRDTKGDENFRQLRRKRRGITILWAENDTGYSKLVEELRQADLVVDALLGTGAARPIEGKLAEVLALTRSEITARHAPLAEEEIAPDVPRFPLVEAFALGSNAPDHLSGGASDTDEELEDDYDDYDDDEEEDEDDVDAAEGEDDAAYLEDEALWDADTPPVPLFPWSYPAILAVDCPSGLNCDTGALDPAALSADLTVTFEFPKWGQLQHPGAAASGVLCVSDIGIPAELAQTLQVELIEPRQLRAWLPVRPPYAHKGTFGRAMIVAGSLNYTGAAYLSGLAAMRGGAGLVTLAIPAPLHAALAGALAEITWLPLPDADGVHTAAGLPKLLAGLLGYDALLIGPGLTTAADARALVAELFGPAGLDREFWRGRTVVDADALNILATLSDWPRRLPVRSILTPHPGEMARLTGSTPDSINAERIQAARRYAEAWGHVVVLKGAHTVIADPDGRAGVLPFALPVLATAGSGDVLAGTILAMLAQGLAPYEAAICGAYLHAQTGLIVTRDLGMAGAIARDFIAQIPTALRQLYTGR